MLSVLFIQMLDFADLFIIHQFLYFLLVTSEFSVLRYNEEWAVVTSCTGITHTYCDLSSLIHDYRTGYKVKVQLVAGDNKSVWTIKKFLPNTSKHTVVILV